MEVGMSAAELRRRYENAMEHLTGKDKVAELESIQQGLVAIETRAMVWGGGAGGRNQ